MKRIWIILILLLICSSILLAFATYYYYAYPRYRQPYQTGLTDDTLRIAFIGDSWAFMHNDHNCQIANILEDTIHRPVKVHSYGICGLTSKEIYKNIYDNKDFKSFFQKRGYNYCYVSAGINDTYKKMSTTYYKESMKCIIKFLLTNNIHPIIQEIPDYNIFKSYKRQTIKYQIIRHISMFINETDLDCKQEFRNVLNKLLQEENYKKNVSIVRYKSWNNNYDQDLKFIYIEDQMHLNEKGYKLLDSVITNEIIQLERNQ